MALRRGARRTFETVLVLILYRVMRWSPRRWWVYFWIATLPIIIIVIFLQPLVIDPLFNKLSRCKTSMRRLPAPWEGDPSCRPDIPRERMFLMYASAKTNQVNAYVTGFGASKRVVVWDTTIQKMTPDETVFIFGHEAGHYVLNHIQQGFVFFSALSLAALYIGYRGLHWALSRWSSRWQL